MHSLGDSFHTGPLRTAADPTSRGDQHRHARQPHIATSPDSIEHYVMLAINMADPAVWADLNDYVEVAGGHVSILQVRAGGRILGVAGPK